MRSARKYVKFGFSQQPVDLERRLRCQNDRLNQSSLMRWSTVAPPRPLVVKIRTKGAEIGQNIGVLPAHLAAFEKKSKKCPNNRQKNGKL